MDPQLATDVHESVVWTEGKVADLLHGDPQSIPSVLRKLHFSRTSSGGQKSAFASALAQLLNVSANDDLWTVLRDSGVTKVLTDVVVDEFLCGYTEKQIYEQYSKDVQMESYIAHVLLLLTLHLRYLLRTTNPRNADSSQRCTATILHRLPEFWDAVFLVRRTLLGSVADNRYFLHALLADVGEANSELHHLLCGRPVRLSSRLAAVLFCVYTRTRADRARDQILQTCNITLSSTYVSSEELVHFFRDTVSSASDAQYAMDVFCWELKRRVHGYSRCLPAVRLLCAWLAHAVPSCRHWPVFRDTNGVFDLVLRAHARDRCGQTNQCCHEEMPRRVVLAISRLVEFRGEQKSFRLSARNACYLLDALGANVLMWAEDEDRPCPDPIILLSHAFDFARSLRSQTEWDKSVLQHIIACTQVRWVSAMSLLRTCDDGSAPARTLRLALTALTRRLGPGWEQPTAASTRTFAPHPPARDHRELRAQGCGNVYCFCFGTKPRHQLYVCKGCWKASYCSVRCQRMSWEQGHKTACAGGPAPSLRLWTDTEYHCNKCNPEYVDGEHHHHHW